MRAAVVTRYGPPEVVEVRDVPEPVARSGQVLVRVAAAEVSSGDARIRAARFPPGLALPGRLALGVRRPRRRVLGVALAGEVVAVGAGVDGLRPGQRACGMTGVRMGAHAELAVLPAAKAVPVPDEVADDDAAAVLFGGTTALHFLREAEVGAGTTVLVNGASGAVGTMAVAIARHLGAEVTGVSSSRNHELVASLGAQHLIDREAHDVAQLDERYDVVFDTVGHLHVASGRGLLRPGGRLVLAVASLAELIRPRGDVITGTAAERADRMAELLGWVADGALAVVHDRILPLEDIVEAHRRVDTGRKVGSVLVRP
jgi:NADPH:quinone reductase-like Zn-dependent oxidoreductase